MSTIIETINQFGADFLTHRVGSEYCEGKIVAALQRVQEPTWDEYKAWMTAFKEQKPEAVSMDTCNKQFNRLCRSAGVIIPKSTDPEAVAKQNQREAQAKRFSDLSDTQLAEKISKLKELDPVVAKPFEKEQAKRIKEANKPQEEAIKSARAKVRDALKNCLDLAKLDKALKALA